jgi:hypothetical protein
MTQTRHHYDSSPKHVTKIKHASNHDTFEVIAFNLHYQIAKPLFIDISLDM